MKRAKVFIIIGLCLGAAFFLKGHSVPDGE